MNSKDFSVFLTVVGVMFYILILLFELSIATDKIELQRAKITSLEQEIKLYQKEIDFLKNIKEGDK